MRSSLKVTGQVSRNVFAVCFIALGLLRPSLASGEVVFHVSPNGNDVNDGTEEKPFATLARAQRAVREEIRKGLTSNVRVLLHGGTYFLPQPLIFDERDSGTKSHSITYAADRGQTVVLSGGRLISGWKQENDALWFVAIPEVAEGKWRFRDLYVNGRRAVRARKPNADDKNPLPKLLDSRLAEDRTRWQLKLPAGWVAPWKNLSEVEAVVLLMFTTVRKQVLEVDAANNTLVLRPPHVASRFAHLQIKPNLPFYLENALSFLDQPGEWYLDCSSGILRYWPRPNEDMTRAEVIAPRLGRLLVVKGTPTRSVQNLHFRGLTFSHTAWEPPRVGFVGMQATFHLPEDYPQPALPWGRDADFWVPPDSAVSFEYAVSCTVEGGEISHTGGGGIEVRRGCSNIVVQGNCIFDIAGNGVMIGEDRDWITAQWQTHAKAPKRDAPTKADLVIQNQLLDNFIHSCGVSYPDAVGVWVGLAANTTIAYNEVADIPHSGISVGWEWGNKTTSCANNRILHNHIHDVITTLHDAGGIYTLGVQPGTVLRGNIIHNFGNTKANNQYHWGLYFDEGGSHASFLIESNCIYNAINGWPVKNANARTWRGGHTWRNNLIAKTDAFAPGIRGYGMLFSPDNDLELEHAPELEPPRLTIEAWVKFVSFPTGSDPTVWILSKNTNEFTNGHYALLVSHRNVGAYLNIGGGRDNCFACWSQTNPVLTNQWNHLAMTYDGETLKVYCNGVLHNATQVARPRTAGNGDVRIGKRADNFGPSYQAVMDEIRIYRRAFSPEEIRRRYEQLAQPTSTPTSDAGNTCDIVAAWSFDDWQKRIAEAALHAGPREPYRSRFISASCTHGKTR